MSWRGYDDVAKVCRVCGGTVTLNGQAGAFRAHTDVTSDERWLAHSECLRVKR